MVKILYVVFHEVCKNDGVTKKINSQITSWRKNRAEVKVVAFARTTGPTIITNCVQIESKSFFKQRLIVNRQFKQLLNEYNPDFVYSRYDTINLNLYLAKKFNLIYEINTNDIKESLILLKNNRRIKDLLRLIIYFLFRRYNLQWARKCVFVTSDLANQYKKFNLNSIISPNTIDLNIFSVVKEVQKTKNTALFFIATPNQPWHGLEYIVSLSEKMPEYQFNIVGIDGENTKNLFFHGYLRQAEYLKILKTCKICIGSFGIHKYGLKESSPLKVREYLAYGYPTILGYHDYPLSNHDFNFLFKVDINDINIQALKAFIESYKNYIVSHDEVRHLIGSDEIEKEKLQQLYS